MEIFSCKFWPFLDSFFHTSFVSEKKSMDILNIDIKTQNIIFFLCNRYPILGKSAISTKSIWLDIDIYRNIAQAYWRQILKKTMCHKGCHKESMVSMMVYFIYRICLLWHNLCWPTNDLLIRNHYNCLTLFRELKNKNLFLERKIWSSCVIRFSLVSCFYRYSIVSFIKVTCDNHLRIWNSERERDIINSIW